MDLGWLSGPFSLLQEALTEDLDVDLGDLGVHVEQIDEHVYELLKPGQVAATGTPSVEFVLYHGLKLESSSSHETHMITTWISRDKKNCWLLWLLEEFPEARILIIRYDAAAQRTKCQGRSDIFLTSENLVYSLTGDNAHVGRDGCPVVLVGHCLGGLILKEVCCQAQDSVNIRDNAQRVESFLANVKGCFFYATPHQGDLLMDANKNALNGRLMKELRLLKNTTARRNQKFCQLRQKRHWSTSSVGEGLPVKLPSSGLAEPANLTGNPLGGSVTSGGVLHWPAMNTLGLEILRLDFAPGGIIMPHTHSLATEILYCLEGEIYTGFVTNSDNPIVPNKLYAKIVKKGEAFIFPRGLVHFQLNKGTVHASSLNTLNSQKPGLQLMPVALFGTGIDPELLAKSFFINETEVASLGSVLSQFVNIFKTA